MALTAQGCQCSSEPTPGAGGTNNPSQWDLCRHSEHPWCGRPGGKVSVLEGGELALAAAHPTAQLQLTLPSLIHKVLFSLFIKSSDEINRASRREKSESELKEPAVY